MSYRLLVSIAKSSPKLTGLAREGVGWQMVRDSGGCLWAGNGGCCETGAGTGGRESKDLSWDHGLGLE